MRARVTRIKEIIRHIRHFRPSVDDLKDLLIFESVTRFYLYFFGKHL